MVRDGAPYVAKVDRKWKPTWTANGNVSAVREYGYGSGVPGALRRTITTTCNTNTADTSRKILNLPTRVVVCVEAAGG